MLSRRAFTSTLAAPLLRAADKRPNVILILTDDQGYGDFSLRRNPILKTPNLDRLAGESVEFTRFSVSPVCAPTRAALLTGRYPLRTGVHGVTKGRETLRPSEVTLGNLFQSASYQTSLIGKWHLGENYPYVPHARGFDEFTGMRLGHWNWYFDAPVERNGQPAQLSGYIADALTTEATRFIDRHTRDPFFLYLAYNTPHAPYQVEDKYFNRFAGQGLSIENQTIYGMVNNLDDNIGRLLAHLEKKNLAQDTIVLFLCDNGPQTDRFNAGLRARKGSVYEGGTRSPLYVRYPAKLKGGRQVDHIASHIDVFPTLASLCGIKPPAGPPLDGVNLQPLLEGSSASWPSRHIFTHADQQPDPTKPFPGAVRSQQYKLVNGTELYDLLADPGEKTNIAAQHPQELARLRRAYDDWFASTLEGFTPGAPPIPVGYLEENPARLSPTQAALDGNLRFHQKFGYAHDFVTGWDPDPASRDAMLWRINAHRAGRYEATVEYRAPAAGSQLSLSAPGGTISSPTKAPVNMEEIHLPHRAHNGAEAPVVHWGRLTLGQLRLAAGEATLQLKVSQVPADIKTLFLKLV
ncbi:MAG: arylsulfatase [Bryobacter sp.]|nr:arylsulfatase [Bryobacter sp.]